MPSRIAVYETAVKINKESSWVYTAIDIEPKVILNIAVICRHSTDPAAAFLQKRRGKHDLYDPVYDI
jgi:putative transposase